VLLTGIHAHTYQTDSSDITTQKMHKTKTNDTDTKKTVQNAQIGLTIQVYILKNL